MDDYDSHIIQETWTLSQEFPNQKTTRLICRQLLTNFNSLKFQSPNKLTNLTLLTNKPINTPQTFTLSTR